MNTKQTIHNYVASAGTRQITFETGKLAHQAGGALTVRMGDSMVFAAATMGNIREGIDFFPLSVEYEERMYASGKIPGSFFRREGRPSTEAILTSRLTDRPIRPLFPKGLRNEVQVIMYSLSADPEIPLDMLGINAASAALMISDIPWEGPVGAVRVGRIEGNFIINPTYEEMGQSDLDLRLAGTREAILMVECGGKEIPEDVMIKALEFGHAAIQPLIETQIRMATEIGKPKRTPPSILNDPEFDQKVYEFVNKDISSLLDKPLTKDEFNSGMGNLREKVSANFSSIPEKGQVEGSVVTNSSNYFDVDTAFANAEKRVVRENILLNGKRPDGRAPKEIRPLSCDVDISPRAHGSGLFTRGETQALTLATFFYW